MDHEALLKTLLHGLQDGVIVCDPDATITLFNQPAAALLGNNKSLNIGDSLYSFCLQPPVKHALELLQYQKQDSSPAPEVTPAIQFMNTTVNQEKYLRCRLNLLPAHSHNKPFFIIIFEDISSWYRPDNLLFMKIDGFRAPMTNMQAAVDNITEHPEMSPVMRSAFENVLVLESLNLTEAFNSLDQTCNLLMQTQSHLTTISSDVLFGYIANTFPSKTINFSAATEHSGLVKIDSYGLLLVLNHLASKIQQEKNLAELSCKMLTGERFIYFDFIWSGDFFPTASVEAILEEKIQNSIGNLSIAGILHFMGGDIWSQQHENSRSTLRLALPLAKRINE